MRWAEVQFEALFAEPTRNGIYKAATFHGGGAKIVNMGEMFAYEFIGSQPMKRLLMSEDELSRFGLVDGDLLFGRRSLVEAGAGKCSIVVGVSEPTTYESSLIRARLDLKKCDPLFYYYWFRSSLGRGRIRSIVSGTNVKGIRASELARLPVANPDIEVQRKIVSLVKPFDDLTENNCRRILLLEESARMLYREWFVSLRFPGHEHLNLIEGVPTGWKTVPLASVCADGNGIQTGPFGSQLHQSDYSESGVPVVMPKDIKGDRLTRDSIAYIPEEIANKLGRHRMSIGDTVYGRRGDIGRRAYIRKRQAGWFCGTGCLRIRPDPQKIEPRYLFETLGSRKSAGFIFNQARGSTMLNLSAGALTNVPILYPPRTLQNLYFEAVEPSYELIENLEEQNQKLAQARDLLLPRLMSGEISV